jgi:hypothetical protein
MPVHTELEVLRKAPDVSAATYKWHRNSNLCSPPVPFRLLSFYDAGADTGEGWPQVRTLMEARVHAGSDALQGAPREARACRTPSTLCPAEPYAFRS